ncbi:NAD(P)H-dependent oxidoreductase [Streptosporangiaceae bacterium NEAU-GS5]|nr:NAD(P)H-dependent oxidoreductase [Streptosporangiaceae bacterium NEAU-GS5]
MILLRVDASIQGPRSASSELADLVLAEWTAVHPERSVLRRHLAADPLPADAWSAAIGAKFTPEEQHTDVQREAFALAEDLAAELRDADAAVLALPLYNFGVSQHVKTWIDLAVAGGGPDEKLLDGKPVVLLTTRGGAYHPGTPREGWDHNTGYLRRILADVWGADLTVVEREFTLVGVNPALDQFADLAAAMKATAHDAAAAAGKALATR